jgi:hypothetical protein
MMPRADPGTGPPKWYSLPRSDARTPLRFKGWGVGSTTALGNPDDSHQINIEFRSTRGSWIEWAIMLPPQGRADLPVLSFAARGATEIEARRGLARAVREYYMPPEIVTLHCGIVFQPERTL